MKEEFDALFAEHQKLLGELQAMRALAQPEQEPVAQWQKRHIEQTDGMWCDTTEADAKWWLNQNGLHGWEVRKVYTTPPQRKPLTHEQRFDLLTKFEPHKNKWEAPAILIDMVEAAHGIKE